MLRLVNTAVVPVPLPVGANGGTQSVEAYNAGDGSLSLAGNPTSSVPWITTSYGPSRACTSTTAATTCIPLQLVLNTSTLAAGTYTASVTVNGAPNVVDAPQTITVTVRIGALTVFVAPGSSSGVSFSTHSPLNASPSTQDGNRWLGLAQDGSGSFKFTFPYKINVAPPASMAQGTYNGSLITSGSSFPPDNQTIPVTMRVTTQPIAVASPAQVTESLAQGAAPLAMQVSLQNPGQGTLTIGAVSATTTDGGKWLTASSNPSGWAALTLDPGTLAPGFYTGSVSIASNAVNGTVIVPVSFQVEAKGAPLAYYKGVVDNAIFGSGDPVAPGDIVALFGEQLSLTGVSGASSVPLPTQLGGATVLVNGRAAPLYSVSESQGKGYDQIDLQVPLETPVGTAQVQVQRDGLSGNTVSVQVVARAPRILVITKQDLSVPDSAHPARVGDYLTIWAIGLGPTNPAVGTNVPAPGSEPLARLTVTPAVEFGSTIFGTSSATPSFAGLSPGSVGLYQINVAIPAGVVSGNVNLTLAFPDSTSNTVQIAVQ
jgi:uncharacterized protein (TIGR03437 family)